MPTFADTLRNGMPRTLLRSPAHHVLSGRYCLLEFTGRRTGRSYLVPVAYIRPDAGALVLSTDSRWWHNLVGRREFVVRLRGQRLRATATRLHGAEAERALRDLVTIPGYARAAGIDRAGGVVTGAALARAAADRVVLMVRLEGAA